MMDKEMEEALGDALGWLKRSIESTTENIRILSDVLEKLANPKPAPIVESVYGKPLSEWTPPAGKVFTGEFRESDGTDFWMDKGGRCCNGPSYGPVLILRNAERAAFEETGRVDYAKYGEYYIDLDGYLTRRLNTGPTMSRYPIYRLVEAK